MNYVSMKFRLLITFEKVGPHWTCSVGIPYHANSILPYDFFYVTVLSGTIVARLQKLGVHVDNELLFRPYWIIEFTFSHSKMEFRLRMLGARGRCVAGVAHLMTGHEQTR